MSKDWQEALQEEVSYLELEEKYFKRTAELSITRSELSRTAFKLNEVNEILAQTQHKLKELEKLIEEQNIADGIANLHEEEALKRHEEETNAIINKRNRTKVA